jgi:hypothetical protein
MSSAKATSSTVMIPVFLIHGSWDLEEDAGGTGFKAYGI